MRRVTHSAQVLVGLAVILAMLLIGAAAPASANHGARITIHKAVCPSDTFDVFGKCHDNRLSGVPFLVAGAWRTTNASGVVTWEPGAGTRTITEDPSVFDDYEGAYIFCSNQVTGAVLFDGPRSVNWVTITTTAGQGVICDWYNLT